jgi:UPF0755 protein
MFRRLIILVGFLFLGVFALGYLCFFRTLQLSEDKKQSALFQLKGENYPALNDQFSTTLSGMSYASVKLLSSLLLDESKIKDGKYDIEEGMTAFQLIRNLRNGRQSEVKLVISKSRNFEQFESKLQQLIHINSKDLLQVLDSVATLDSTCRRLAPQSYLGLIIPETHRLYWNSSSNLLVRKFKAAYLKFWNDERLMKAQKLGLSRYQVMVLASIVEEETSYNPDKPKIAAVYYNRFKKGMRLQADPTVIFAWQDYSIRRVMNKHLAIESPYNTYLNLGFPPAPICIPSISSIDAVLSMPSTTDLYFCADPSFNGRHVFSSNYSAHLKNAHAYQAAYNQRFDK